MPLLSKNDAADVGKIFNFIENNSVRVVVDAKNGNAINTGTKNKVTTITIGYDIRTLSDIVLTITLSRWLLSRMNLGMRSMRFACLEEVTLGILKRVTILNGVRTVYRLPSIGILISAGSILFCAEDRKVRSLQSGDGEEESRMTHLSLASLTGRQSVRCRGGQSRWLMSAVGSLAFIAATACSAEVVLPICSAAAAHNGDTVVVAGFVQGGGELGGNLVTDPACPDKAIFFRASKSDEDHIAKNRRAVFEKMMSGGSVSPQPIKLRGKIFSKEGGKYFELKNVKIIFAD